MYWPIKLEVQIWEINIPLPIFPEQLRVFDTPIDKGTPNCIKLPDGSILKLLKFKVYVVAGLELT